MKATGKAFISAVLFFSFCACSVWAQREVNASTVYDATSQQKADEIFYEGVRQLIQGKSSTAEDDFLQFLKIKPNEPAAYYELSKINFDLNKPDKSEDYIKQAIKLDSDNKWYREQYAAVLINRNDFADAGAVLDNIARKEDRKKRLLAQCIYIISARRQIPGSVIRSE